MKYHITQNNLVSTGKYSLKEAQELAIKIKKASPNVKVMVVSENDIKENEK